jgi:hypothetical protein
VLDALIDYLAEHHDPITANYRQVAVTQIERYSRSCVISITGTTLRVAHHDCRAGGTNWYGEMAVVEEQTKQPTTLPVLTSFCKWQHEHKDQLMPTYDRQTMCGECPFRVACAPRWPGPWTSEEIEQMLQQDTDFICHSEITKLSKAGGSDYQIQQQGQHCVGFLRYQSSMARLSRDPLKAAAQNELTKVADQPAIPSRQFTEFHARPGGKKQRKKKATVKRLAAPTNEQILAIGDKVLGTRSNVYFVAKAILGHEIGEEIFDMLEKVAGIFKCEHCSMWLELNCREKGFEMCSDCLDAIDRND